MPLRVHSSGKPLGVIPVDLKARAGRDVFNRQWIPLNALRAFEAVGRQRSFTLGAQAIGVTQSAVSRHVASLEDLIGRKLLVRKAHAVTLTEAGEQLLPAISKSFDRLEQVLNELQAPMAARGRTLRVHFPPSFLARLALPLLGEFRARFPDVDLDVISAMAPGLPAGDCDAAVVYDQPQVSDAIRDLLWLVRASPVCAPALAADVEREGLSLQAFVARHEQLHVRVPGQPQGRLWQTFAARHGLALPERRGLTFDTMVLAVQYAMAGSGVALADVDMFADEIADGRLAVPFAEECEEGFGYYLTLAAENLDDPVIAAFRSWIIARFAGRRRSRAVEADRPAIRLVAAAGGAMGEG